MKKPELWEGWPDLARIIDQLAKSGRNVGCRNGIGGLAAPWLGGRRSTDQGIVYSGRDWR